MTDILIESVGALIACIIFFVLIYNIGIKRAHELPGSKFIIIGFALIFFGTLIDITDNFPQLNYLVVIGDTEIEAFLEKVVGRLFGLLFLLAGLCLWLPSVIKLQQTQEELESLNDRLDERVKLRTNELENINERLLDEVGKREMSEDKLKKQALFDGLTELPNRMLALDRLTQLTAEAKRGCKKVAILFLDIDDFKKVNDTLGHETGDKLLCQAATRLSSAVRSSDTVARFGGDEFIVILGGLSDASEVSPIVEKLLSQLRTPYLIDRHELNLTASIGASVYPDDGEFGGTLLRKADSAMYHSKKLGRNTCSFFTDKMNTEVTRRLSLEEQMQSAIARGEFTVYYQPKININNNNIIGTEALLRWSNPVLGDISPVEFIPVAEQTGLIVELGEFVLNEAMRDTAEWKKKYDPDLTISVNLSPRQFRDPNLTNYIDRKVKEYFSSGSDLELEITEGVLMSRDSDIDDAISRLNKLDVSFAMDDFGTGYSSLSYLRQFPFNVLKIDKSFIEDITTDPSVRTLIKAAVAMAHGLDLEVVAEGIETKEQLAYLKEIGCNYGQGYYFSRPIPFNEMGKYLNNRTTIIPAIH